jgi:hypothetical protein
MPSSADVPEDGILQSEMCFVPPFKAGPSIQYTTSNGQPCIFPRLRINSNFV